MENPGNICIISATHVLLWKQEQQPLHPPRAFMFVLKTVCALDLGKIGRADMKSKNSHTTMTDSEGKMLLSDEKYSTRHD